MSVALLKSVSAGAGSWPILSAVLAISTGFIITTGALGAIWPEPTHQTETLDKMPTASLTQPAPPAPAPVTASIPAMPAAPAPPPVQQAVQSKIPDTPDAADSTREGVRKATYHPPGTVSAAQLSNTPQIMSVGTFNDSIAKGDIYAASLSDYERSQDTRVTGTPDELALLDQKFQQSYADAVAAGGTSLTADGVTGVVVGSTIARQYGYAAASPQAMQNISANRQYQAAQRQQQQARQRLASAGGMRNGGGGYRNTGYGGMHGGYGGFGGGMHGGFGGGFGMHGGGRR